jgi:hypothetical protein
VFLDHCLGPESIQMYNGQSYVIPQDGLHSEAVSLMRHSELREKQIAQLAINLNKAPHSCWAPLLLNGIPKWPFFPKPSMVVNEARSRHNPESSA